MKIINSSNLKTIEYIRANPRGWQSETLQSRDDPLMFLVKVIIYLGFSILIITNIHGQFSTLREYHISAKAIGYFDLQERSWSDRTFLMDWVTSGLGRWQYIFSIKASWYFMVLIQYVLIKVLKDSWIIYDHNKSFNGIWHMSFLDNNISIGHDIRGYETQWLRGWQLLPCWIMNIKSWRTFMQWIVGHKLEKLINFN